MLYATLEGGTVSTPMKFEVSLNTNTSIQVKDDDILLASPSVYEIQGTVTMASTAAGLYGLKINAEEDSLYLESNNTFQNLAAASGEKTTIPIYTVVKVVAKDSSGMATFNLAPIGAPTVISGSFSVKRIN